MIEPNYLKLTTPKPSEYNVYRKLSVQEETNPKNKFDNRLYFSLRYKHFGYNSKVEDELFDNNRIKNLIKLNFQFGRRINIFEQSMVWGSNKYGQKKLYKLERFFIPKRNAIMMFLFIIGANISYFCLALHYKKLEYDVWMRNYGDFFPFYAKIGDFTARSYIRKIPFYLHYWKLVSTHNFKKYDLKTVQFPTGYENAALMELTARKLEYKRKRDDTFDFMQIGEDDFPKYYDRLT